MAHTLALFFVAYAVAGVIAAIVMYRFFHRAIFADSPSIPDLIKAHPEHRPMLVALAVAFAAVLGFGWPVTAMCWALLRVIVLKTMAATHQKHCVVADVPPELRGKALSAEQTEELRAALRARGYEQSLGTPGEPGYGQEMWDSTAMVMPTSQVFFFSARAEGRTLITFSDCKRTEMVGFDEAILLAGLA
jgi:hypothetical protein